MGDFDNGVLPNGVPAPGPSVRPGESFEPQSFEPQGSQQDSIQPGTIAEETFVRASYPPQAPFGQQQAAYPAQAAPPAITGAMG